MSASRSRWLFADSRHIARTRQAWSRSITIRSRLLPIASMRARPVPPLRMKVRVECGRADFRSRHGDNDAAFRTRRHVFKEAAAHASRGPFFMECRGLVRPMTLPSMRSRCTSPRRARIVSSARSWMRSI